MSKKYTWEENNKRYAKFKEALEVKGDGKCYFHAMIAGVCEQEEF